VDGRQADRRDVGWSEEGDLPLVVDGTSCTNGVVNDVPLAVGEVGRERHAGLEVIDSVIWGLDRLVPRLEVTRKLGSVAVHPTCSGRHLGLDRRLRALAAKLADEAQVPPSAACCGFTDERGFLHPELTAAATVEEAAEVRAGDFAACVSSNRTCEIAMERATGRPYVHVIQLLEELTRTSVAADATALGSI
jgi:D-lactate dehydrogenase